MAEGRRRPQPGGGRYAFPVAVAVTALLAASLIRHGAEAGGGPPQPDVTGAPAGVAGGSPFGPVELPPPPPALGRSTPTRVRVPALRVDAPVIGVGDDGHDGIAAPPPTDRDLAGWYTGAPTPGQQGTAVIDGHVDTLSGPAVFYGLGSLRKGDTVDVVRADGRTAVFTVYGVAVYAKKTFPGDEVYAGTGAPELRVITCGGGFTKKSGYDSDVVVYARLTAVR
jgi:hypothetical protein